MRRREFIHRTAGYAAATLAAGEMARAAAVKPNILVIMADDMGYANLGPQGGDIPTPNLDALARGGVRFTNGYVSCPVCSPTRAGLMTGRYQQRFGHEFNTGRAGEDDAGGLPLSEVTLADRLKKLGYGTGIVGKWHLGYRPEQHPMKRGFDEFFGFLGGSHPYISSGTGTGGQNPILRGAEPVREPEYLTDAFTREALAFIERRRSRPFFLYLAYNAVHGPMQAAEKYTSRFASIRDEKRRTYAGMLAALDDGVGAVLRKLRDAGIEENTLVFFASDNGGPTRVTTSRNDPLRGFKGEVFEGGIRVPFMAQWKGRIEPGRVFEHPVITLDIHSTALVAAGGPLPDKPKLDGVDLAPYITGRARGRPHDRLFWRFGERAAIRLADWKMVMPGEGPPQLYNLARDAGEASDLSASQPQKLKELQAAYEEWSRQLAQPLWLRGRPSRSLRRNQRR